MALVCRKYQFFENISENIKNTVANLKSLWYNVFVENWFSFKFYYDYYNKENIK